jgi:hypothetical protein
MPLNQPYALGGNTKGVNFNFSTAAINWGQVLTFDPSGIQGFYTGTVNSSTTLLSSSPIAEWAAYKILYTEYRVRKIKLKFHASSTLGNSLDDVPVSLLCRYQKEWIANPGAASGCSPSTMSELRNVVRKTFTADHPDFEYSFYPKVARLVDAAGTGVANDGRVLKAMPFTSVNVPVDLWGVQLYMNWPGSAVGSTALIQMDIEYDIEFRNQS